MIVSAIMWQLQRIQRLERAIGKEAEDLGRSVFDLLDAVLSHIASEELIFGQMSDACVRAEWEAHRAQHARARVGCFTLATCHAADVAARFDDLRTILRAHAQHEMRVVSALRAALGGDPVRDAGERLVALRAGAALGGEPLSISDRARGSAFSTACRELSGPALDPAGE